MVAKFDQRQGSSDGGAILLKAAERRIGLTSALAAGLRDDRQPGKVQHELRELLTQRVMALALGYEDANDAARLVYHIKGVGKIQPALWGFFHRR